MNKLLTALFATATLASIGLGQYYSATTHIPYPGHHASLRRGAGGVYGGYTIDAGGWPSRPAILTQSGWKDLMPAGQQYCRVHDVFRTYQVGYCGNTFTNGASYWRGSAPSFVNLHPQGQYSSNAYAMEGDRIVGYVTPTQGSYFKAAVWTSPSSTSLVYVHPNGWAGSILHDTDGVRHCGVLRQPTYWHAGLWNGTSLNVRDMHPLWASNSMALAMHGPYQVGFATVGGQDHATRWQSTANSAIDIHPVHAHSSTATGIFNGTIVGWYSLNSQYDKYAAVLDGPYGFVDLHQYLPANYDWSVANGIADDGYVLGEAHDTITNTIHAVIWKP